MKERPILMSTENVKAILEPRKTQTRRVINPQPNKPIACAHDWEWKPGGMLCYDDYFRTHAPNYCPYGQVGDRLWVRETFCEHSTQGIVYKADYPESPLLWRPSIHMRIEDSRITLEITEIRVERLQEITEEDAKAEGITTSDRTGCYLPGNCDYARWAYWELWDSLNPKYPWESNPWVWVISFKPVKEGKDEEQKCRSHLR